MKKQLLAILIFTLLLSFIPGSNAIGTDFVAPDLIIGGTQGSGNSEFDEPDSVYVDADGVIYAGDTENFRVQVFDENGTYLKEFTGFSSEVSGNEVQGIGELSDGTIVVVEKAGNLFFFNKNTTLIKTVDLTTVTTTDQVDTQGLAVNTANDQIYISNQPDEMIIILDADGVFVDEFSTGQFSTPENIAIDPTLERVYISLEQKRTIDYYTLNGTHLGTFGNDIADSNYEGLAIDSEGYLWAVDEGPESGTVPSRIILFSPENFSALYAFGGSPGSADGHFMSPDGLAYDSHNNRLAIGDQGNYRVQLFDLDTVFAQAAVYEPPTSTPSTTDDPTDPTDDGDSPFSFWFVGLIAIPVYRRIKK